MSEVVETVFSLALETSGFGRENCDKGHGYQIVSLGLIAANADTFETIDSLYTTIKWNGVDKWSSQAESIHHFSKSDGEYEEEDVAAILANFILNNNGADPIVFLSHNFSTFGYWFIRDLFDKYGIELFISTRCLDTFTLAKTLFGLNTQNEIFNFLGNTNPQNTLEKAEAYLKLFRVSKKCWARIYEKK